MSGDENLEVPKPISQIATYVFKLSIFGCTSQSSSVPFNVIGFGRQS
jgi:hypothetical protein